MKILVTGGTGYIGSHTVIKLLEAGHEIVIVDNLSNSKITVLDKIEKITDQKPTFYQIDLLDFPALKEVFESHDFDLVMHFAGLKAVAESVANPLLYYKTNLNSTINLLECMKAHNVSNIIFSSSATVYGNNGVSEYTESSTTGRNISNPYGKTKYFIEEILKDVAASWPEFSAISLRYFNPIGNHPSGLIGEDPNGIPNNLMPIIMKVFKGEIPELSVYGDDYSTPDGTCRRDYIHVTDLANGHLAAMSALVPGFSAYNLGTGTPTSVLEIITAFEEASGTKLPYKITSRRPGDLPELFANTTLAKERLNWQTHLTIKDAMRDTLNFLNNSEL